MPFELPPLFQAAPVAVASLDLDGRIRDVNRALLDLSGYAAVDIIGLPFQRFIGAETTEAAARFAELAAGTSEGYRAERQYRGADGQVRDVRLAVSLVRDRAGNPELCLAVVEDVTGYNRAIEAAREARTALELSEARYRALVDQAPLSIQILSPDGRTLHVNTAWERLWGLTLDQLADYNVLHDPQLVERGLAPFIQKAFDGEAALIPVALYDPDRTLPNQSKHDDPGRWVRAVIYPIKDAGGRISEVVLIHEDMTEQVRADIAYEEERERLLVQAQRAHREIEAAGRIKDEFLATLSHELRTPLNAILGWTRILTRAAVEPSTAHALDVIHRNALAQARLVDDLLDVSSIISGKIRLNLEPVDLGVIAAAAVETVRPAADAKALQITFELDPALPQIIGDMERLQQVFWNLLSNAVKFTEHGGRILLRLSKDGDFADILVRDTGIGIAPEMLPHVFDRFTQADSSTTRPHAGLGLGLAIVRHLVESHGGSIRAESGGLGKGALFGVRLPLTPAG